MMSKKVEAVDINTLSEKEKDRLYNEYKKLLGNDRWSLDELDKYFDERYPGLIKNRIQKHCYGEPRIVDDADEIDASMFFNDDWLPKTDEEWEQFHREDQEYDDEERKDYLLYDPGSRQKILYPDCIKKYGRILTDKMFQADNKNSGTVDLKTWQQIQDIHKKYKGPVSRAKPRLEIVTVNVPEPEIVVPEVAVEDEVLIQRVRKAGDDYYMRLERGVIRNKFYKDLFKPAGRSVLYEHLWTNIAREGWIDKPGYPIKERYYNNGYLAYCSSVRQLGDECCLDKKTVKKSLDAFKEAGVIKIEHIIPEGKTYGQTVAILGEWSSIGQDGYFKICERYYRDEVFLAPAPDVPFRFKK